MEFLRDNKVHGHKKNLILLEKVICYSFSIYKV